jgi:outer membrane receptor protein involved in Fe transport
VNKRGILLGVSLFAIALPSYAQTPGGTPTAEAEPSSEMIVVTGSRISRPELDSVVPVASLSIGELTRTGDVNLGEALNDLPQLRSTFGIQNSGNAIGTAGLNYLDLRGQGTTRTLVLQNGRRHVSSGIGTSQVDVNTIATDLVERVDIVTGANSAVYGSDAIAGVVNFVTIRNFEGLRIRGQNGLSAAGDRPAAIVSLTAGKNFNEDRTNVAVNFEFSKQPALFYSQRDDLTGALSGRNQFQQTDITVGEPAAGDGIPDNTFLTGIRNINISNGGLYTSVCPAATPTNAARRALNCTGQVNQSGAALGRTFVFMPDGTLVANPVIQDFRTVGSTNSQGGLGSTLRDTGLLQIGLERVMGTFLASHEFSPAARAFLEFKYFNSKAVQEGQPTFNLGGGLSSTYRLDNPFLTQQNRDLLTTSLAPGATTFSMARFNVDFGGRGEDHERNLYRIVGGLEGNFLDTWRYEVSFNYGHFKANYATEGNVISANVNRASDAALNAQGQIVCRVNADADPANDDPACRPLNVFGENRASQEALNYILYTSTRENWNEQMNALAYVSGDSARWFELPGGPIGFVVGGEWRQERSYSAFDPFTRSGATFLNSIAPFDPPTLEVWEFFAEARVPIIKDKKFIHELSLEGATRYSNYNVGGTGGVWTYNGGGIWAPAPDIKIRGNYGRAIRAPTQFDLFNAGSQTFLNGFQDPCGQQNINNNPNRTANCAAAGVPTTQTFIGVTEPFTNITAAGVSGQNAGNPNLNAERSDSFTLGAVIQPRWVPGFSVSIDWYDIQIENVINTLAAQTIINECYNSTTGIDNQYCRAVFRRPDGTLAGQGSVNHAGQTIPLPVIGPGFLQGPFNYASQQTKGIDMDVRYTRDINEDWGFSARAVVSHLLRRDFYTNINDPTFRTQQKLALGDPAWEGFVTITPRFRNIELWYTMQYVGKMTIGTFAAQNSVDGRAPENADQFPQVFYPDVFYHDLRLQANLRNDSRLYIGVDNVTNTNPPLGLLGDGDGSAIYSSSGRFIYVGVDWRFGGRR